MTCQEAILCTHTRIQRQLCNPVRDQVQVGNALHILREKLEKASIINGMVVIMAGVHIQRMLGHRAACNI